ncbi:MAG: triphosphoribosyl-dephospho-CoA synthase CitG [Bacillota bacterium]
MHNHFCQYISELAVRAMLYEVSATPKPGLVDRNNPGAHKDMDFYTFMASSAALSSTFYLCTKAGMDFDETDYRLLLQRIRPIGIEGEKKMFAATKGINTHKGLVFSLGILAAAVGSVFTETQSTIFDTDVLCKRVQEMTKGISEGELFQLRKKENLTYGEKLFLKYGIKGIRGEVESGFKTVRSCSLPVLRALMQDTDKTQNDIYVQVLLHLMALAEDSNVLGRHDLSTLSYVKEKAKDALSAGGIFTAEGRQKILDMDEDFIMKHISPGGSADLLAVTLILYFLENPKGN